YRQVGGLLFPPSLLELRWTGSAHPPYGATSLLAQALLCGGIWPDNQLLSLQIAGVHAGYLFQLEKAVMTEITKISPTLIVLSGLPGSGKTVLAEGLSRALSLPMFSIDPIEAAM